MGFSLEFGKLKCKYGNVQNMFLYYDFNGLSCYWFLDLSAFDRDDSKISPIFRTKLQTFDSKAILGFVKICFVSNLWVH